MLKIRKGDADIVAFVAIAGLIITGAAIIMNTATFDSAHKGQMNNAYDMAEADGTLTDMKQTFEKTALFFGMMKTTNELGWHGGVSQSVVDTADSLTPKMYAENKIPYLAVALCPDGTRGCETKKRMPFLFYVDKNTPFGTVSPFTIISGNGKYAQNMDDVAGGKYSFYVLVQAIILKPGASIIKACQKDRCMIKPFTETGFVTIKVDDTIVKNSADDITLTVAGYDKDAAVLREVAVSIYDKDVVESPNKLLNESINIYQKKMPLFPKDSLTVKINPFEAAFIPAGKGVYGALDEKQGFARGIAWAPAGISAKSPDVYASSAGIAEEEAKIRYWRMYAFADYFVDNLLISKVLARMNEHAHGGAKYLDYYDYHDKKCFASDVIQQVRDSGQFCPRDPTPAYSAQEFVTTFNNELNDLIAKLNDKYQAEGFKWKISVVGDVMEKNFEQISRGGRNQWIDNGAGCCVRGPSSSSGGLGSCFWPLLVCDITTSHEYILKDIKLLVEITDEKYKTFDSATNTWINPTFKFYYDFHSDDMYCWDANARTWKDCKTFGAGSAPPSAVEIKVP